MYWIAHPPTRGPVMLPIWPMGRVQRHRVHHVFAGHQVGGQGEPGRHLHRHQAAQNEHDGIHVPHLRQAGQRQNRQDNRDHRVAQHTGDQEQLPVHPVGQHPADEGKEKVGHPEKAHRQTQRGLLTSEVQDEESDAKELDPLPEGLDPDIQKEPPEVPVAKGGKTRAAVRRGRPEPSTIGRPPRTLRLRAGSRSTRGSRPPQNRAGMPIPR